MKSKLILIGLITGIIFIVGCYGLISEPEEIKLTYKCPSGQIVDDLSKCSKTTTPSCGQHYTRVGSECCLDRNENRICDRDEKTVTTKATTLTTKEVTITTIKRATTTTIKKVAVEPLKTYKIGDTISGGDLAVTVNSFVRKDVLKKSTDYGIGEPRVLEYKESGKEFVIVDLTVQNIGTESAIASSFWNVKLQDSEGYMYTSDLMASQYIDRPFGGGVGGGELIPGQKMRGEIPFLIPKGSKKLQVVFNYEMFGLGQAIINLE